MYWNSAGSRRRRQTESYGRQNVRELADKMLCECRAICPVERSPARKPLQSLQFAFAKVWQNICGRQRKDIPTTAGRSFMEIRTFAFIAIPLFCISEWAVSPSEAVTSFNGSTIIGIDQKERTVTFRTKEGDRWTLPIDDPEFLEKEKISPGDQVSIEIDPNDK